MAATIPGKSYCPRPEWTPTAERRCSACHNNKGGGSDGNEPDQVYSDFAYHSIALPFNRRLNDNVEGADPGLFAHDDLPDNVAGLGDEGIFKTPTLRNATKNERGITKAFFHNGYFKNIEDVVHFYNTRFDGTPQDRDPANNSKAVCEDSSASRTQRPRKRSPMIAGPMPEFPGTAAGPERSSRQFGVDPGMRKRPSSPTSGASRTNTRLRRHEQEPNDG